MSDKLTKNDQVLGIFMRNEFQAAINEIAVCEGLFKKDRLGNDVTASNGLIAPLAVPAMGVRAKDISGISKGIQIGNKKLTDKFIKFKGSDQVLNIGAADPTFSRIDLVVAKAKTKMREDDDKDDDGVLISPAGTLVEELVSSKEKVNVLVRQGVPSASPVAPIADSANGEIALAKINISPATTSITSAEIQDCRKFLIPTCEQFDAISDSVAANTSAIDQLRLDVQALDAQIAAQFQALQQQILTLVAADAQFDADIASAQAQLNSLDFRLIIVESLSAGNAVSIADIVNRLSSTGDIGGKLLINMALLSQLQADLAALQASSAVPDPVLSAAIAALSSDITVLQATLAQVQTDVVSNASAISQDFTDLSALIADNAAAISVLQAAPSGGGDVTTAQHTALQTRVTDLETTVGAGGALNEVVVSAAVGQAVLDNALSSFSISGAGTFTLPIAGSAPALQSDDFESGVLSGTKWIGITDVIATDDGSGTNKVMRLHPSGLGSAVFTSQIKAVNTGPDPTAGKVEFDWKFTPAQIAGNARMFLFVGLLGSLGGNNFSLGFSRNPQSDSSQDKFGMTLGGVGAASIANTVTLSGGAAQSSVHISIEGTFDPIVNAVTGTSAFDIFADGQKLNTSPIVVTNNGNFLLRTLFLSVFTDNVADGSRFFDIDNYKLVAGLGSSTQFATSGVLETQTATLASAMASVKSLVSATTVLPAGTSIAFEVSLDGKANFIPIVPGAELVLAGTIFDPATPGFVGNDSVDLRITLATTDNTLSPEVSAIVVSTTGLDIVALQTRATNIEGKVNSVLDAVDASIDFAAMKAAIAAIVNL